MKSDAQLQKDVMAELKWEPSVHASDIGVEVKDGVVTLAGHVGSYTEKWNAEHAAQRVAGVKALAVEMDVNLPGLSKRTDADIARSAENVLQWTSYLHKDAAKVMVEKGWITLSGEVDWEYQRAAATNAVRHLLGVTGVSNQMGIKPAASSTIKTDIETALKRRARSDIDISVNGSSVTLTGTVDSWALRDLASQAAWGTQGVDAVMNRISVAY